MAALQMDFAEDTATYAELEIAPERVRDVESILAVRKSILQKAEP